MSCRGSAALPLTDDLGEQAAADELLLPGSPLADLVEPDSLGGVAADLVQRWGADVLAAVGVLVDLTVAEQLDVVLDPAAVEEDGPLSGLADWVAWSSSLLGDPGLPPTARVLRGVRELDVVADGAWERLLARVSGDPALRSALLEPVAVELGGGGRAHVPSYTSWWLRTRARLHGKAPGRWASPTRPACTRCTTCWNRPREWTSRCWGRPACGSRWRTCWPSRAARTRCSTGWPTARARCRRRRSRRCTAPCPRSTRRTSARRRWCACGPTWSSPRPTWSWSIRPHHVQLRWSPPALVVALGWAGALADVLDVRRSSQAVTARVTGGSRRAVPEAALRVLPTAAAHWWEHDEITVDGSEVDWWVEDRQVHAATLDGLARGLAWAAGRWADRWLVAAVLESPERLDELLAEDRLGG